MVFCTRMFTFYNCTQDYSHFYIKVAPRKTNFSLKF